MQIPAMGSGTGPKCSVSSSDIANLPKEFDWRSKGVVTPIKVQGNCGSCYAFSAIGAMESGYQIHVKGSGQVEFSEQDIINCYSQGGRDGCGNGFPWDVLEMSVKRGVMKGELRSYKGSVCFI